MKESATFLSSATITVFLSGCIIIAHDLSPDFRQFLVGLTGHHWISVSLITIMLFSLSTGIFISSKSTGESLRVNNIRLWATALTAVTLIMILGIFAELVARYLTS